MRGAALPAAPVPLLAAVRDADASSLRRILMTTDAVGGVWSFTLDLSRALSARGVAVDLAILGPPPSDERRREARAVEGLALHELPGRLEWMEEPWDDVLRAGRALLELEARISPDVVHLNGYALASAAWRAPTVVTGHSCVLSWWRACRGSEAPREWDPYRRAVADGLAAAGAVAAPTRAMLAALEALYPLPRRRAVVMNGRTYGTTAPRDKEKLILGVGRFWDEAKNLDALERAAAGLPWALRVAGDTVGPDGRPGRADGEHVLGRLEPAGLEAWYARAGLFAHPARYEPFGLAPLEAALSGCALVLGDIPSLREVWADAAVFVPPEDVVRLRLALIDLIEDRPRREELARRAGARARRYTPERMAAGYLDLYADVRREARP